MKVLGIKADDHDGSIAVVNDGSLISLIEAEKLGQERTASMTPALIVRALTMVGDVPDAVATSDWDSNYKEIFPIPVKEELFLGKRVVTQTCGHARSHILASYGMSAFNGQDAYCLLWEGSIGSFYEVSSDLTIRKMHGGDLIWKVGNKYKGIYKLVARKNSPMPKSGTLAGTMMAALAMADDIPLPVEDQTKLIAYLNSGEDPEVPVVGPIKQKGFNAPMFRGILDGVSDLYDPVFLRSCKFVSNYIFSVFYEFAKVNCSRRLPLIIAGGCGYNCDWNTGWKNSGLFTGVFVPPIPGDCGVSLGAAMDLQYHLTGVSKIDWDVFSGPAFVEDHDLVYGWSSEPLFVGHLARILADGHLVPVAYGRAEIGPRALGHRSLLMDPTLPHTQNTMNRIKNRQGFRPVAPTCTLETVSEYFDWSGPSPFMLYFQKVLDKRLVGVTHVDGTARVQTVTQESDPFMHSLLNKFQELRGVACLANSSLNKPGMGFLTSASECARFAGSNNLKYFVAGDRLYTKGS